MPNRLKNEKSLYLQQHANNPVDWYPWSQEALDKAQNENKPILISIGYSSCHWCHVMAHECFEDNYIADLMNEHFICIKIDREERPDLDQVYMETVQMLQQQGGWPLNVFCLPDGKPFFGGTYFPPEDRGYGIVPWPQLLIRISDHYKRAPAELIENAKNICSNLEFSNKLKDAGDFQTEWLLDAATQICKNLDQDNGGFGDAPKFPPPMILNFLLSLRYAKTCENKVSLTRQIDKAVQLTLDRMACSGIYDQIGGGFYRYCVDAQWVIPHFEKMLNDNAQLIKAYTKGYLQYRNPLYKSIIEETIHWLLSRMLTPNGGFAASLDADTDSKEGLYYVWSKQEILDILGPDEGNRFCEAYNVTDEGNFKNNTTHLTLATNDTDLRSSFKDARNKLLEARHKRTLPTKDLKQIVSWMSLAVTSLTEAGFYFNRPDWLEIAGKCLDFIWDNARFDEDRLYRILYENKPHQTGCMDDYSFYAKACLDFAAKVDILQINTSAKYIERAKIITNSLLQHFQDTENPGFFFAPDDQETIVCRKKEWVDTATPAGNASLLHSFSMLYALTGDSLYLDHYDRLKNAFSAFVNSTPSSACYALEAITNDALKIPVIKVSCPETLKEIAEKLRNKFWRKCFLFYSEDVPQSTNTQMCIGTQCYMEDNTEALLKKV